MLWSWEDWDPPVGETLHGTSWHVKTPLGFWLHILVWLEPVHLPVVRNVCDFPQVLRGLCHLTIQCSMAMTLLSTVIWLSQFEFLLPSPYHNVFPTSLQHFPAICVLPPPGHRPDLYLVCAQANHRTHPHSYKNKPDMPNTFPLEGKSVVIEGRGSVNAQIWWFLSSACFWYTHKPAAILLRQQYL